MGERYTGWHARSGDANASPGAYDLGKKLLGYLAEQRRLAGTKTLVAQRTMADGTVVRAGFIYDLPFVEVYAPPLGPASRQPGLAVQGFVARPNTASGFGEVLLSRGAENTWENRFYTLPPTDPSASATGQYKFGRLGVDLFADGLKSSGNLDWRNRDESFVVSFFGPVDRYFNQEGQARNAYSRYAFINGDCVLDIADLPATSDSLDFVLGACATKEGELVWAVARPRRTGKGAWLRFYHAPLTLRTDDADPAEWTLAWSTKYPWEQRPRYAKIPAGAMVLFYETEFANTSAAPQIHNRHPFVFNQSATEGRMLVFAGNDNLNFAADANSQVRELVLNFADGFDLPQFTDTQVNDGTPYTSTSGFSGPFSGKLDAYQIGENGFDWLGDPYTAYAWSGAPGDDNNYIRVLDATWLDNFVPGEDYTVAAVDYKADVPVYAERRNHTRSTTYTYASNPQCTPEPGPGAEGSGFTVTNTVAATVSGSAVIAGLRLPWLVDGAFYEITGLGTVTGTADGNSTGVYRSAAGVETVDVTGTGSHSRTRSAEYLVVWSLDLRSNSVVWSKVTLTETTTTTMAQTTGESAGTYTVYSTHTGPRTITKSITTTVHLNGATRHVLPQTQYLSQSFTSGPEAPNLSVTDVSSGGGVSRPELTWTATAHAGVRLADDTDLNRGLLPFSFLAFGTRDALVAAVGFPANVMGSATVLNIDTTHDVTRTPNESTLVYTSYPAWVQTGFYGQPAEHMHRVFGNSGPAVFNWAKHTNNSFTGGPTHRVFGYWQTLRADYAFSMPWPNTGGAARWLSELKGGDIAALDGVETADRYYPIFTTTRFNPGP